MRWGPPKLKKKKPTYKLWFAWYPVLLYEGRWMWWEWCIRHRERIIDLDGCIRWRWSYETFFEGVLPFIWRANIKRYKKGW